MKGKIVISHIYICVCDNVYMIYICVYMIYLRYIFIYIYIKYIHHIIINIDYDHRFYNMIIGYHTHIYIYGVHFYYFGKIPHSDRNFMTTDLS